MNHLKSQIAGQVFIYILSLIVVVLVLLYGYKAIQDFRSKAEEVALINFKNNLEKVLTNPMRYGDTKPLDLKIPNRFEMLCFLDTFNVLSNNDKDYTCLCKAGCTDTNPLICDAWKTTNLSNAYLYPISELPINLGPITVDGNGDGVEDMPGCSNSKCFYICLSTKKGEVSLLLHGKGDHIFIEPR
jgi:hypothetical protein